MEKLFLYSSDSILNKDSQQESLVVELRQKQKELEISLDQLAKKNRYETIVRTVTQSVHSSLDIQEVFENAVESISNNVIGAKNVSIHIIEGKNAVIKAFRGYPKRFIQRIESIPYPKDFTWRTILDRKSRYCSDVEKDTVGGRVGIEIGTKSYLSIPIYLKHNVVGVINITSSYKDVFDKDELDLLELVAKQIESAIKNARQTEALKESESRYRTLFENVPTGIYRTTPEGNILDINPALIRMLGYSSMEELALNELAKKHFTSKWILYKDELERRGEINGMESMWEKKDASIIYCYENIRAVRSDEGNVLFYEGTVEDVTKRKIAEEELKKAYNNLEIMVADRTKALVKGKEKLKNEITARRKKERELKKFHNQLRELTQHLENIREDERTRISREVHDELGQSLTGLKMDLTCLKDELNKIEDTDQREMLETRIEDMSTLIDCTVQVVRRIAMDLRPGVLDDLGTIAAIDWQAQEFERQTGINCVFNSDIEEIHLEQECSTAIFRIFQETLINVARHAKAANININFKKYPKKYVLEVEDDGKGILEKDISAPQSLGLLGIKERALLFGGKVEIMGETNKGTVVSITVPFKR
ncbi:MAG: PAS domain S-box protein [Thermodesulfobacteriota bacterium]